MSKLSDRIQVAEEPAGWEEKEMAGAVIKRYLAFWDTTQKDLAKVVGISPQYVADIIQHRRTPSALIAYAIFDALCMSHDARERCVTFWVSGYLGAWGLSDFKIRT